MSSDDDYHNAFETQDPLPPGSTGTPGPYNSDSNASFLTSRSVEPDSPPQNQPVDPFQSVSPIRQPSDMLSGVEIDRGGEPSVNSLNDTVTGALTIRPSQRTVTPVSTAELLGINAATKLFKHVVAPAAKAALKRVVAPTAKVTLAQTTQAYMNLSTFQSQPSTGPPVEYVEPLVRAAAKSVGTLARTASGVLASASERSWSNNLGDASSPAKVIDDIQKSSDDMPPKRGSDLRPGVARAELQRLYEQFAPAKLDENPNFIDDLLDKYQGRYGELLKMVRQRYTQTLSSAVSAPDEPDVTPRKAAPTVTSAQIEAGPATPGTTPQPYHGTQTPPQASPVRHTSRNGSQLVHVDSDASFLSTLSHGERPSGPAPTTSVAGEPRGLARLSSRSGSDGPDRTVSAPVRPGDFQQPVPAQSSPAVINQEAVATAANPQTAPAAATAQSTQSSATQGMNAVASAARAAQGASPETLVSLYEELQRNTQLKQLVAAGLLNWRDLLGDKEETLPDGTRARVVDAKKLLALQQRLSTLAQREAGKLQNIQEVAVQQRTVPGLKAPGSGAIYPGVSVFMYPRELPAGRPR